MARDRWEYCVVDAGKAEVRYITIAGWRKEKARDYPQVVAELGEQGWELVSVEGALWFKRRPE